MVPGQLDIVATVWQQLVSPRRIGAHSDDALAPSSLETLVWFLRQELGEKEWRKQCWVGKGLEAEVSLVEEIPSHSKIIPPPEEVFSNHQVMLQRFSSVPFPRNHRNDLGL